MKEGDVFVGGFDYARGGSDLSNASKGDDFSFSTFRIRENETHFCHVRRETGIDAPQASAVIHDQQRMFNYAVMVGDPGGGGLFVRDELRKPIQTDGNRRFPARPIITYDDLQLQGIGDPILVLFQCSDTRIGGANPNGLGLSFKSSGGLINLAHEKTRTHIEKRLIMMAPQWEGWSKSGQSFANPDAMRKWLNRQTLSTMDRVRAEMDLTVLQLMTVDRKTDKEGKPMQDSHGFYTFMSKRKKDSAYSFVYCDFAAHLYRELHAMQSKPGEDNRDFIFEAEPVDICNG